MTNVNKLESENAIIAEKIQTDADTKWKLVVEETQNKLEMEKAALVEELRREKAAWDTVMMDNRKVHREKAVMKSKLEEMKKELKEAQAKRKSMVEKMKEMIENEMATTNPKSNKKAKH